MRGHLILYVNGVRHRVEGETAFLTLTEFLRQRLRLCGTKVVCSEGDCGACSVLVGSLDGNALRYAVLDACITFLHQLDLCHVVTVEGLTAGGGLHPVQRTMIDHYGSQCGFCTPGFITTLAGAFEDSAARADSSGDDALGDATARRALTGNLCRCTGYWQILEACAAVDRASVPRIRELFPEDDMVADLAGQAKVVLLDDGGLQLYRPADLATAAAWRSEHPDCRIVVGATDLGVQHNRGQLEPRPILSLGSHMPGFTDVAIVDGVLRAGAGARWSDVLRLVADRLPELGNLLELFGAPQIRNAATVGGNIANASPIADSLPFFYVTESRLELLGPQGPRSIAVEDFYRGYKETDLRDGELIASVEAPLPTSDETLRLYKMSRRQDLDIASFNAAILLRHDGGIITRARIAYGGVGPTVVRLPETESFLIGKTLSEEVARQAGSLARTEITPISDVRGSAEYRLMLAENVLRKFFYDTLESPPPGYSPTPSLLVAG